MANAINWLKFVVIDYKEIISDILFRLLIFIHLLPFLFPISFKANACLGSPLIEVESNGLTKAATSIDQEIMDMEIKRFVEFRQKSMTKI